LKAKQDCPVNGCGCESATVTTKDKLVFGTLDNEPVNDYRGKIRMGSELAISYSKIKEHKKATAFGKN
jgi:hypothetical protein